MRAAGRINVISDQPCGDSLARRSAITQRVAMSSAFAALRSRTGWPSLLAGLILGSACCLPGVAATPAPDDALLYFIWPADGAVIKGGRFWLRMGLRNMGVAPKGVRMVNTGHHHLIVDAPLTSPGEAIPSDRNHLHFGAGETEARIELPPGRHTLQLLLGDQDHAPHAPPVFSKPISILVVR